MSFEGKTVPYLISEIKGMCRKNRILDMNIVKATCRVVIFCLAQLHGNDYVPDYYNEQHTGVNKKFRTTWNPEKVRNNGNHDSKKLLLMFASTCIMHDIHYSRYNLFLWFVFCH